MPILNYESKKAFDNQQKIQIEVLKEYTGSHEFMGDRRNWRVARIRYEGCPIMYICNAGWMGTTYPVRYLIDRDRYQYMTHYLFSLMKPDRGGENHYSLSGMLSDRQRVVQPEMTKITDLPKAIREIMAQYGDI
jgi:hypothetical protein